MQDDPPSWATGAVPARLRSAQIHHLYSQARFGAFGAVVGAFILTASLWGAVSSLRLVLWLTGYSLVHGLRHILIARFFKASPEGEAAIPWDRRFQVGATAGTLFWGMAAVFLFPAESVPHQFILAVCVTGITTAAAVMFAATNCYLPCILAGLLPLSARFFYEGGENLIIGAIIFLFAGVLIFVGRRVHAVLEDSLLLRMKTESLVQAVNDRKNAADGLNSMLNSQISQRQKAEDDLRSLLSSLESLVEERTEDVRAANRRLLIEISDRERAEVELKKTQRAIELLVERRTDELAKANERLQVELEWKAQAQVLLEESEKLHRMLVETAKDIIWTVDLAWNFSYVSPSITDVLGYTVEEVMSLGPCAILTPDSGERVTKAMREDLKKESLGPRGPFVSRTEEIEQVRKDGGIVWAEISATFLRDADGNPTGILGISRDITGRKEMEEALKRASEDLERQVALKTASLKDTNEQLVLYIRERDRIHRELQSSEERFRAVFESAEEFIFIKDRDLKYSHVNPAMFHCFGFADKGIIGKTDDEVFGPSKNDYLKEMESRVLAGQAIESEHVVNVGERHRVFRCSRVPLHDSSGKIVGLCGMGRDITDEMPWKVEKTVGNPESGSAVMRATLEKVQQVAQTESIVLFLGESGSGKDYLARYLHENSQRSTGPFFAINCAALPSELAESELFGHEAGAFTGASGRKRGLLELAEGGTILLNEIGELSPGLQAKLLMFLDTQSFTRIGGQKSISVNARILAATNRDLAKEAEAGRFRSDLFYRINVFPIIVPPLRDRPEDIPLLSEEILEGLSKKLGRQHMPVLAPTTIQILRSYHWPGNVRELRNVLERALILCNETHIGPKHVEIAATKSPEDSKDEVAVVMKISDGASMKDLIEKAKKGFISEALRLSDGNVSAAARSLGVSRDVLRHEMKKLGPEWR
ncbi:MAG: sigma 54-interacting transcriptional regulator [Desulfomonile tiedjei]|nr:sigma 54-interacting transcriptional regulator [Desulfomonile tiedjei]